MRQHVHVYMYIPCERRKHDQTLPVTVVCLPTSLLWRIVLSTPISSLKVTRKWVFYPREDGRHCYLREERRDANVHHDKVHQDTTRDITLYSQQNCPSQTSRRSSLFLVTSLGKLPNFLSYFSLSCNMAWQGLGHFKHLSCRIACHLIDLTICVLVMLSTQEGGSIGVVTAVGSINALTPAVHSPWLILWA
jgi:hypothetical protein